MTNPTPKKTSRIRRVPRLVPRTRFTDTNRPNERALATAFFRDKDYARELLRSVTGLGVLRPFHLVSGKNSSPTIADYSSSALTRRSTIPS